MSRYEKTAWRLSVRGATISPRRGDDNRRQMDRGRLREHRVEGLADRAHPDELAITELTAVGGIDVRLGHDAAAEPHLRRLADAQRRLGDPANFAGEPHLAEHRSRPRDHAIAHAGSDRGE